MKYQNIPFQPEEGSMSSLHTVHLENKSENNSVHQFLKRNKKLFISGGFFALLCIIVLCTVAYMNNVSTNEYEVNETKINLEATGDAFAWGDLKSSFCKTSCTSPCAKFPSMYGELCCNWTPSAGGGTVCALGVTASGICTCGTFDDSASVVVPALPPAPVPVPVPAPKPVAPPTPVEQHHPSPGSDNGGFHPFPTMKWEPIVFNPFPTMAWLPFNPIGIPEGATPCKRSCQHACSQSQSNGESYCCEATPSGSCSTTQINGQCYCS